MGEKMTPQWSLPHNKVPAFFKGVVTCAFMFLEVDYGFTYTDVEVELDWEDKEIYTITYRSPACEVTPILSLNGKYVTCSLERLEHNSDGALKPVEVCDISYLIKQRCPNRLGEQQFEENTVEDVKRIINAYADILKEYGRDLLSGNPESFRELLRVREEELRKSFESGAVFIETDETGETVISRKADDDTLH